MELLSEMNPIIRENLGAMLELLRDRLDTGQTSDEAYAATLKHLRFRIGEDLFDLYSSPLAREMVSKTRVRPDQDKPRIGAPSGHGCRRQ